MSIVCVYLYMCSGEPATSASVQNMEQFYINDDGI